MEKVKEKYIVLVSGSRDWNDSVLIQQKLSELDNFIQSTLKQVPVLVHGACARGADALANHIIENQFQNWEIQKYPAQWDLYGRSAGPKRNTQMLSETRPHAILIFCKDNSPGSTDMINKSEAYKKSKGSRLQKLEIFRN